MDVETETANSENKNGKRQQIAVENFVYLLAKWEPQKSAVCSMQTANASRELSTEFDIRGKSRGRGFSSPENRRQSVN